MPPVELTDFTSYDLGRLHEALAALPPDYYGPTHLWSAVQAYLPWNQRARSPWADEAFAARYAWLRAQLVPEGAKHDYPLRSIVAALARLLDDRLLLDRAEDDYQAFHASDLGDDEPF